MKIVNDAYGDGIVMAYHIDARRNFGDSLARFIASEIRVTFDPKGKDQIAEAIRKMEAAREQIDGVIRALEAARKGGSA